MANFDIGKVKADKTTIIGHCQSLVFSNGSTKLEVLMKNEFQKARIQK